MCYLQTKTQMLDNLLDIEIAYSMLKDTGDSTKDPIDTHYQRLNCPMEVCTSPMHYQCPGLAWYDAMH